MNRVIRKIENFLQTDNGQRFLQYGYSFGAAIVIFGAMVKVLHLWDIWGNIIFGTGMAIEVIVFILYGLDRPPQGFHTENAFQASNAGKYENRTQFEDPTGSKGGAIYVKPTSQQAEYSTPITVSQKQTAPPTPFAVGDSVGQLESVSDNVIKFSQAVDTLTRISESLQDSYRHIIDNSQDISKNSLGYVQQMEALNRNISGLNTIYEIQLKGISGQIETLDQINKGLNSIKEMYAGSVPDSSTFRDETEKMTKQIQNLNQIYGRLIQAMTSNQNL